MSSTTETVSVTVERGWQVLVASGFHLRAVSDEHSEANTSAFARRLETWIGPGLVVLAGDTFELLDEPNNSPRRALTAHPRFAAALRSFAEGAEHTVVVLAGDHDAGVLVQPHRAEVIAMGATVAARLELEIESGAGLSRIRVEHRAAPGRAPMVDEDEVAESAEFYRVLDRWWWLPLVAPIVVALVVFGVVALRGAASWEISRLAGLGWAYLVCSILSAQTIIAVAAVTWLRPRRATRAGGLVDDNRASRAIAADLTPGERDGYVGAGGHAAELVDLGGSWYANPGSVDRHLTRRPARWGLPAVFAPASELSWLELEAGAQVHVQLIGARRDERPATWVERVAVTAQDAMPAVMAPVARLRPGVVWPTPADPARAYERVRRRGAAALAAVGVLDFVSSVTPPWRTRLGIVRHILPVGDRELAAGFVAASGLALILLAIGLRRGRRIAWQWGMTLVVVSAIGHIVKGFDLEESAFAGMLGLWLMSHRLAFQAPSGVGAVRRAALVGFGGLATIQLAVATWVWLATDQSFGRSVQIAVARTAAIPLGRLPSHSQLLVSALPSAAVIVSLVVGWYAVRAGSAGTDDPATVDRAWAIVREHGRGTLDYFALRDDKLHFVCEHTVIAYTVVHGTAVVSPDPVGPADQRSRAWFAFRMFAAENGWRTVAFAAGAAWLPIYRATGMRSIYIGDEAVVDVRRFNVDGGRNKSLRQAVNRVGRAGYTVEFHDPAELDPALHDDLRALARQSRRGPSERGFSMTLSRLFDPRDRGLLLALARDPDGRPAAFCQYVPAPGIDGYSLDVMRRADVVGDAADGPVGARGAHPNGLSEYLVVKTIEHLRGEGHLGLALHFATMRAHLAGESGSRIWHRLLSQVMHRLSADMQIESLWRFNAKFDPAWVPRYVVLDRPESTLHAGLAIARLESLWELPIIGRMMVRPDEGTLPDG